MQIYLMRDKEIDRMRGHEILLNFSNTTIGVHYLESIKQRRQISIGRGGGGGDAESFRRPQKYWWIIF